jgi:hypothetical protein
MVGAISMHISQHGGAGNHKSQGIDLGEGRIDFEK